MALDGMGRAKMTLLLHLQTQMSETLLYSIIKKQLTQESII